MLSLLQLGSVTDLTLTRIDIFTFIKTNKFLATTSNLTSDYMCLGLFSNGRFMNYYTFYQDYYYSRIEFSFIIIDKVFFLF